MTPRLLLVLIGSAVVIATAGWTWRIETLRARHLAALIACRAEKTEQAEIFRRTQKAALDLATAARTKKEAEHESARQTSDASLADLRARYRALVLRKAAADHRDASRTYLPENATASTGADGADRNSGVPARVFIITQADALICADNSARLQTAQHWALSLAD